MSILHSTMIDFAAVPSDDLAPVAGARKAYERIVDIYDAGIAATRKNFEAFATGDLAAGAQGATYPYLLAEIGLDKSPESSRLAYGKVATPGLHGTTVTAPRLFRTYLTEQLELLEENHGAKYQVGHSHTPIPLTFSMERAAADLSADRRQDLRHFFDLPDLASTNDSIVDCGKIGFGDGPIPLSLFPAERVDYSLHRLRHYTATDPEHFQRFVLFTNYQRYVDEFIEFGRAEIEAGRYARFVEPGNRITEDSKGPAGPPLAKLPQMPAYHLVRDGRTGITLINIGVGPSNAKTATDHLAVLRPHVWLMVGHCGGLRSTQRLGDYVLAHAYLRDDKVLNQVLPSDVPLPTIAEVQVALTQAVSDITGLKSSELKERLRTGTVVTTDDRNWELRFNELSMRFNQSRAIAIDMESATIAANGYRFRVPYGTLLCVSDRPLHGEIKLPGMADAFYEERVSQHLQIGIKALDMLRADAAAGTLHSRKLRSFDEPAFR